MRPTTPDLPLAVGDRLPPLTLPSADGGPPVEWRDTSRGAAVLVLPHSADCRACRAYLETLAAGDEAVRLWGGRTLALLPAGVDEARAFARECRLPFPVIPDPDGDARRRCGVLASAAAVLVADRWGQLYDVAVAGAGHELPSADEVEAWLRFLATQCPECGVPDEPGLVELPDAFAELRGEVDRALLRAGAAVVAWDRIDVVYLGGRGGRT